MKPSARLHPRARLHLRFLLLGAAVALLGVGYASLPEGNDALRELPIQPHASVPTAFPYPGPQAIYAAP